MAVHVDLKMPCLKYCITHGKIHEKFTPGNTFAGFSCFAAHLLNAWVKHTDMQVSRQHCMYLSFISKRDWRRLCFFHFVFPNSLSFLYYFASNFSFSSTQLIREWHKLKVHTGNEVIKL